MFHRGSTSSIALFCLLNFMLLYRACAENFKFIALPQEQQQSIQNQLIYQQQFQFGQEQQQRQQQPSEIIPLYGNENAKQYSIQTNVNHQQPQQQQHQQRQSFYQQQQQQQGQPYLSPGQQDANGYKFQSLTNANRNTNNQQTIPNQNRNQNPIQMQQYTQVPLTFDDKASHHTNQQQFYYPLSYSDLAKSQQQQQRQSQEQQHQQTTQSQSQHTQHNQQQIQRFSPKYNYVSMPSSVPLSTNTQPTSKMSTAFIRGSTAPAQLQQQTNKQQIHQQQVQQRPQILSQRESQQILSKPSQSKPSDSNDVSELLPSYLFNTDDSMSTPTAVCTRCCRLNQNPCLECCSEDGFLSTATLKVLAG